MFGLFGKAEPLLAPDEPIEIRASIAIDKPEAMIYALLDFSDMRNQMRARGNVVKLQARDPDVYRLWHELAPDLAFLFAVTDAVPTSRYAFTTTIFPVLARRLGSHEIYTIAPLAHERCKISLINMIRPKPGLTQHELHEEVEISTRATVAGLTKLKLQAEQGVAAVEAYERELGQRAN